MNVTKFVGITLVGLFCACGSDQASCSLSNGSVIQIDCSGFPACGGCTSGGPSAFVLRPLGATTSQFQRSDNNDEYSYDASACAFTDTSGTVKLTLSGSSGVWREDVYCRGSACGVIVNCRATVR